MLPQKRRLPYSEFRAQGYRTQRTPFFSLKIKSNGEKGSRVGIIAGKNVHKTAAKRNFWKRQASAILAALIRGDHDAILIIQARVNELSRQQFRDEIKKAVRELS